MHSQQLSIGRTFGVVFDHAEDFFTALRHFCETNGVRQGYIPMFIAGFSQIEIVGTCAQVDDPQAPLWTGVHLTNIEALGAGTIAYDENDQKILPHIHVSVGLKQHSATAHTSHLLAATVQFLTEMLLVEVTSPAMRREPNPELYNVPLPRLR
jgi:predicted DNA-binding protein with PD1-like motif